MTDGVLTWRTKTTRGGKFDDMNMTTMTAAVRAKRIARTTKMRKFT